jgi:hypothetical protein
LPKKWDAPGTSAAVRNPLTSPIVLSTLVGSSKFVSCDSAAPIGSGRSPWTSRGMINPDESKTELTETMLEIGAKLFPRRYHRFKDLRSHQQACEWAQTLDWRQNPYDRFLLRRELMHHIESTAFYEGHLNVYSFASRDEIAAEVDRLLDEFPDKYKSMGVFSYVLVLLPYNLAFKHGQVRYNRLAEALGKLP